MIDIVINNCKYACPTTWDEVVLRQAIEMQEIAERQTNQVKEYFVSQFEPSAHEPSIGVCNSDQLLGFMIDVAACLCGVSVEELRKTDPVQLEIFVVKYLSPFIVSVIFEPVFTPRNIKKFEWHTQTLLLPTSGLDIEGSLMPLETVSAEQLCLATDLHIAGSLRYAAMIVAILCREEGERFSVKQALSRAKTMNELPMSIVLEVFFCFRKLMNI